MPYRISTLLTRNLQDVFGENDAARRRAAIDEIFTEDCVFYGPSGRVRWVSGRPGEAAAYAATDFAITRDAQIAAIYLFFDKRSAITSD
jgi:hypothetical protein